MSRGRPSVFQWAKARNCSVVIPFPARGYRRLIEELAEGIVEARFARSAIDAARERAKAEIVDRLLANGIGADAVIRIDMELALAVKARATLIELRARQGSGGTA